MTGYPKPPAARAPRFTLITVPTLALAIGANTAIFTVVDAVLIDPMSHPHADRLVTIQGSPPHRLNLERKRTQQMLELAAAINPS